MRRSIPYVLKKYPHDRLVQTAVSLVLLVLTLVCGTIGFHSEDGFPESFFQAVGLLAFEGFEVNSPNEWLIAARAFACFFAASATFAVLLGLLGNRLKLAFAKNHIVVIGLGRQGPRIVDALVEGTRSRDSPDSTWGLIVLVDLQLDPTYRNACMTEGMAIVEGDATKAETLREAGVHRCRKLYVFCGDDETDMQIAHQAAELIQSRRGPGIGLRTALKQFRANLFPYTKEAVIMHRPLWQRFTDTLRPSNRAPHSVSAYLELQSPRHAGVLEAVLNGKSALDFRVVNIEAATVRALFRKHSVDFFCDSGHAGLHAVVIGDSKMAHEIVRQLMLTGHFESGRYLRLTILTKDAEAARERFLKRFAAFKEQKGRAVPRDAWVHAEKILPEVDFTSLDFDFLPTVDWQPEVGKWFTRQREALVVFAAVDGGASSSVLSTRLVPELAEHCKERGARVRMHTYVPTGDESFTVDLEKSLSKDLPDSFEFQPFEDFLGNYAGFFAAAEATETLAQVINYIFNHHKPEPDQSLLPNAKEFVEAKQAYEAYQPIYAKLMKGPEDRELRKAVEDLWAETSFANKESSRQAAFHAPYKLAIKKRCSSEGIEELLARVEHRRWCADHLLRGFRPLTAVPPREKGEDDTDFALSDEEKKLVHQWFTKDKTENRKSCFKNRQRHVDLVPFDAIRPLIEASGIPNAAKIAAEELHKDVSQICAVRDYKPKKLETAPNT